MSGGNLTKEKHSILGIEILTKKLYLVLIGLLDTFYISLGNRKQREIVPLIMDPADKAATYY